MNEQRVLEELSDIFREVLNDQSITLTPDVSVQNLVHWDSMSHITISVAAESRFGIKFRTTELEEVSNVGEFVNLIAEKMQNGGPGSELPKPENIRSEIRNFLTDNFLSGRAEEIEDSEELLDNVIDSSGVLELVAFIQDRFAVTIPDDELIAENLESVSKIVAYINQKLSAPKSVAIAE